MTKRKKREIEENTLSPVTEALRRRRLLLVWADIPFPPDERPPRNPALAINRWQEQARALPPLSPQDEPWAPTQLPPLPILSLDPTERVEDAFHEAGVSLNMLRTRRDLPGRGPGEGRLCHDLLKLGGDLVARAGLFLSWDDVRAAPSDPDQAHLLREAGRLARDGVVLVVAPSPGAAFDRFWRDLLLPALREATRHLVLGPPGVSWPAPLERLDVAHEEALTALADVVIPPPVDLAQVTSLRLQLAQARENLRLIEERESEYVLPTDVPLQLVKDKRRLEEHITELKVQLGEIGAQRNL